MGFTLFDPLLLLATIGLAAASLVVIAGATRSDVPGQPDYYVNRQGIYRRLYRKGVEVVVLSEPLATSRFECGDCTLGGHADWAWRRRSPIRC